MYEIQGEKIRAVLFLNMGGPNNIGEVSLFLKNMFNDKNILTIRNRFFRSLIARIIVFFRLKKARLNYHILGGRSPIIQHTQNLISSLNETHSDDFYAFAMNYTPPFAETILYDMQKKGISEILLFSLYPHYSSTTTLSSFESVQVACEKLSYYPHIQKIEHYFDNPIYNNAIIHNIEEGLKNINKPSEEITLIFSAHALPEKIIQRGDPYKQEVINNIDILKRMMKDRGIIFKSIDYAFQSHLGPVRWTKPYLYEVLEQLKGESVLIYPISFTIDNAETDFELSIEYREHAKKIGICSYHVCSCLNNTPLFREAILNIIHNTIAQKEENHA